jgi:hypothetical protein
VEPATAENRRRLNDDRARIFGRDSDERTIAFVCECDADCRRSVLLSARDLAALRPRPLLHPVHLERG